MSNYVKAYSWDRPEKENALFYAIAEEDKEDIKKENPVFGDQVFVITSKILYMWDGSDWAEIASSEGGGGGGDVSSIIIHAIDHTTKEGYAVPVLTDDDIVRAYNGVVAGHNVFVVDDLDFITIQVLDASSIDDIAVRLLFTDALVLTYKVGGEIGANWLTAQKASTISETPSDDKFVTESALAQYLASGNNGDPKTLSQVDLDYVYNTGFYFCNICTHRPGNANGILIVSKIGGGTNFAVQLYLEFAEDRVWVRFRDNNAWKSWKRLATMDDIG